jgi:hypothetical protein
VRRPALDAAILLLVIPAVAGCGGGVELGDLFEVQRFGSAGGASLTLVVNEGGSVRCIQRPAYPGPAHPGATYPGAAPSGPTRLLSDPQLVLARGIQEELHEPASKHLSLPPQPGSVFSYYVRDPEGTVHFADNSASQPAVLRQLAYFVLEVAQSVCHLRT